MLLSAALARVALAADSTTRLQRSNTVGPLFIVALLVLWRYLDSQQMHLQHPATVHICYDASWSYGIVSGNVDMPHVAPQSTAAPPAQCC